MRTCRPLGNAGLRLVGAMRWKLVNGKLFQMDADPGETTDMAADHPDVVECLQETMKGFEECG